MQKYNIWPGKPYPLGANWDGNGVNFAIFSENATSMELCLFSDDGKEEIAKIPILEYTNQVWHIYLPDIRPGQLYGYRVHGQYEPATGHRFNPNKLLLDPYAKAIHGTVQWEDAVFGYTPGHPDADLSFDERADAAYVPKCVVVDPSYDWDGDAAPKIPYGQSIIYEMHLKGFTMRHPEVPLEVRGTYAGLTCEPVLKYFRELGITAVELMPIHHFTADRYLLDKNLTNYWGYNSIGYFAPHAPYARSGARGQQVREFKDMVKALHHEGIEVILDVVYNHTAEGNQMGPTLCFRGIDNAGYYRLVEQDKRFYMDYTGTGNTLNMMQPNVLQLIMDSLRYWIQEMHVDGFRFDLAAALARELHDVDRLSSFFDIIRQDPVISQVKLIAEPWDVGEGGYQVGKFPPGWTEWNGRYRDTVRDYWRGEDSTLAEFASRLTGSPDLYGLNGRLPTASVNFITAHDGFTLNDLVSYNEKHNQDNGENNQDGESHNRSWNCGEEGPSSDPEVNRLRDRQKRNFLATLLVSQGVPMILYGDEAGRTQQGNNNAYCQDNEISWLDWGRMDLDLLEFTRRLIQLRKEHPVLRQLKWFQGIRVHGEVSDIGWFNPAGEEMSEQHWTEGNTKSLGAFLNGEAIYSVGTKGERIVDDNFYLLFNAHHETVNFTLPNSKWARRWIKVLDTTHPVPREDDRVYEPWEMVPVEGRSMWVLRSIK